MVKFDQSIEANLQNPRYWRTHKDAFEGVWYEVLDWMQEEPGVTAKSLLKRPQNKFPGCFDDGQLGTLQRRVKEWRKIMARELVYAAIKKLSGFEYPNFWPHGANSRIDVVN